jgi:hypothetical protein
MLEQLNQALHECQPTLINPAATPLLLHSHGCLVAEVGKCVPLVGKRYLHEGELQWFIACRAWSFDQSLINGALDSILILERSVGGFGRSSLY